MGNKGYFYWVLLVFSLLPICLGCTKKPVSGAIPHSPVILDVWADPPTVGSGGTCKVVCSANDPDGDTLSYSWVARGGTIEATSTQDTVKWIDSDTTRTGATFKIKVTVSDNTGLSVQDSITVEVSEYYWIGTIGTEGKEVGQFSNPLGIEVDDQGFLYVTDSGNHRFEKFNPDGTFFAKIDSAYQKRGEKGPDYKFNSPHDIAVAPNGTIFVVDLDRVYKYNSDCSIIDTLEHYPSGYGTGYQALSVAVDKNDKVYSALINKVYVHKGSNLRGAPDSIPALFTSVRSLTVDKEGNLYVLESDSSHVGIKKFDSAGNLLVTKEFGAGEFTSAYAIAIDGAGYIYVTELGKSRIQKFSPTFQLVTKWGSMGSRNEQLNNPCGIAVDNQGIVYVADTGNNFIKKFKKRD